MDKKLTKKHWADLEEQLQKEAKKLQSQVEELKSEDPFANPDHASDNAAVDTDVREQVGHETIEAQTKDLQRKLNDIRLAIKKIEKGKYGTCEKCGVNILLARLKILPEARYCVTCETKLRK